MVFCICFLLGPFARSVPGDDDLNVYWYHLCEKRSVSQSPVDPVTGVDAAVGVDPLPDEEEEAE